MKTCTRFSGSVVILFAALFIVPLSLLSVADMAMAQGDCEIEYLPEESETNELLKKLKEDDLAEAFTGYINKLDEVRLEGDRQEEEMKRLMRNVCVPLMSRSHQQESEVASYNSQCGGTITDEGLYNACMSRYNSIQSRAAQLDADTASLNSEIERLNAWGRDIVARGERPRAEARYILDPANLDEAFLVYALKAKREAGSDCAAMARTIGVIGKKVNSPEELGKRAFALMSAPDKRISFGSSGFKEMYDDDPRRERHSNQVRHFVGYFGFGLNPKYFDSTSQKLREALADCKELACDGVKCKYLARLIMSTECNIADYRLGVVAAELGTRIKDNPSLIKGNLEGYVYGAACR